MQNVKEMTIEELKLEETELKNRLKEVVSESVVRSIKVEIQKLIDFNPDVPELKNINKIDWEFHGEYDDEGGTQYYPSYVTIYDSNGEDFEGLIVKQKSSYSDTVYEYELKDVIHDCINEYSSELYEYDIDEITF